MTKILGGKGRHQSYLSSRSINDGFQPSRLPGLTMWLDAGVGATTDGACQFSAAQNQLLYGASNATLQAGSGSFTAHGWFAADALATGTEQTLVAKATGVAAGTLEFSLSLHASVGNVAIMRLGSASTVTSNNATLFGLSAGSFVHVAFVYDSGTSAGTLYYNGIAVGSISHTGPIAATSAAFTLGARDLPGTALPFGGRLDSWGWCKQALTSDDVTWLYNSGAGRTSADLSTALRAKHSSWWDMDELDGIRYDSIGANHLIPGTPVISPALNNGNFETAGAGGADVFASWNDQAGTSLIERSTDAFSGSASCRIRHDGGATPYCNMTVLTTGVTYGYVVRAKGTPGAQLRLGASSNRNTHTLTSIWSELRGVFHADTPTIIFHPVNSGNDIYVDEMYVFAVGALIDPTTNNGGFELAGTNGGSVTNVSTATRSRSANVATLTTATPHGLTTGNVVTVASMADATYNASSVAVTVVGPSTFSYANTGVDEASTADTAGRIATDVFASWIESVQGASMVARDTAAMETGTACARLDVDSIGNFVAVTQNIGLPGAHYHYSLRIRGNVATAMAVANFWNNAVTTSWSTVNGSFEAWSAGIDFKRNGAGSTTIYLDSIVVASLGPTTAAGIAAGMATHGEPIKTWNDRSGNGRHAVQGSLASKPTMLTAPSSVVATSAFGNGRPGLDFDSVDDAMSVSSGTLSIAGGQYTVFAVVRSDTVSSERVILGDGTTASQNMLFRRSTGFWALRGSSTLESTVAASDTNPHVVCGVFNGASSSIRVDGVATNGTAGSVPTLLGVTVGNEPVGTSKCWDGRMGELILYNRALSSEECKRVERYLANKFTIAVTA